jgi:hypothetical protein
MLYMKAFRPYMIYYMGTGPAGIQPADTDNTPYIIKLVFFCFYFHGGY